MRTFSCVLCVLLAAACWAQTSSPKDMKTDRLLQQAISHLKSLISTEKDNGIFLHSPTNDIEECCSQSALECFRKELTSTTHKTSKTLKMKLARNLGKPSIITSLNTCKKTEIKKVQCMTCDSYPKVNSKQFLVNLQSRLQKAYSRLP